ncbi:MAG: Ldh family oxidoreductase [Chitinophagaceae bacterium]|nr:Ldh family oxidoreductase [Chitinophagaceae bacterium]
MSKCFSYSSLHSFAQQVFVKIGCTIDDAKTASDSLLSADLRGVDSHGIARLTGYVRLWEVRRVNTKPEIRIVYETPSTAVVTGDSGLGLVVAPFAMQLAIAKAHTCGSGWVSVKNSNHFGIAGRYAMMALQHDMIGIAMTNASALVAPTFSAERLLGTNPIAVAVPAGTETPFVADFATSVVSKGKLEILQRKGLEAPEGWTQTKEGTSNTDAKSLEKGGALLPLGGNKDHGSYKGYALGAVVDIFSGILSGANYATWVPPFTSLLPVPENMPGEGIGHFLGAMRIDAFRSAAAFKKDMDQWIRRVKSARTTEGQSRVYIPGEIEKETEAERMTGGIPLADSVVADLRNIAVKFSMEIPQGIN